MYVVTKERLAWMDVEWTSLNEAGESVTNSFRMKVELVELDPFEAFLRVFAGGAGDGDINPRDFITSVAKDWDEILDEDKKPFPFTPENVAVIIQSPGFLTGWQLSYVKAWNGQVKVREKNSSGSPGDGRAAPARKPRRAR